MMEWTLTGLFGISALLLVFSIIKTNQAAKVNHKEVDMVHISMMKEINTIQESIRDLEIDIEVVTNEAGVHLSSEKKLLIREVIDMYRRNYSIESIANKIQLSESEIEKLLAPYQTLKDERRKVANEN